MGIGAVDLTPQELPQETTHSPTPAFTHPPPSPPTINSDPTPTFGEPPPISNGRPHALSIRDRASVACCEWMVKTGISPTQVQDLLDYFVQALPQPNEPAPLGTKQSLAALALSNKYFSFDALCEVAVMMGIHVMPFISDLPSSSAFAEQYPELMRQIDALDVALLSGNSRSYMTLGHIDPFLLSEMVKDPSLLSKLPRSDIPLSLILMQPSHYEKITQGI